MFTSAQDIHHQISLLLWSLDDRDVPLSLPERATCPSTDEPQGTTHARALPPSLVLKPPREGGGNNVFKLDILPLLDILPAYERQAWIAMELIVPRGASGLIPSALKQTIMGLGQTSVPKAVKRCVRRSFQS